MEITECTLPKFFKRQGLHLMMFGYIAGQRQALPSISIDKAIISYLNHFNIDGDTAQLKVYYFRMLDELRESERG
jgi:hypothetical protein